MPSRPDGFARSRATETAAARLGDRTEPVADDGVIAGAPRRIRRSKSQAPGRGGEVSPEFRPRASRTRVPPRGSLADHSESLRMFAEVRPSARSDCFGGKSLFAHVRSRALEFSGESERYSDPEALIIRCSQVRTLPGPPFFRFETICYSHQEPGRLGRGAAPDRQRITAVPWPLCASVGSGAPTCAIS